MGTGSPHRIDPVSLTPTVERQTPRDEFGHVLSQTVGGFAGVGVRLLEGVSRSPAVVSAAVSNVSALASATSPVVPVAGPSARGESRATYPSGGEVTRELLQLQHSQSHDYLRLQMEMQRESREFTTFSNVIKVRHESARTAINNLR